ncbi:large conductance mechanosensitive channel protein MscL [Pontibacillus yanchengensis]|uniref:Large-conductance mechanosensitive channel n=1 Tax=Pontibacillus yanchengensis Y32 TaxID=1385514 RepID=A0A0A2TQ89_9BACI|nr:large conductance mechanosensitive channel protein MscL [Pontibacillus yanchengensis]KGP71460.1 mechanosensitive ion channel protein MscL [Pontibacillus yanchengensis Y32]
MWEDFKSFLIKENTFDLAIAVIIGGAFSKIVESLVSDLVMPVAGFVMGGVNLQFLSFSFRDVTIHYGAFLQAFVDFFIITFAIFMFLKIIFRMRGKSKKVKFKEETTDKILGDIRELLREQKQDNPPKDKESNRGNNPLIHFQSKRLK